MSVTKMTETPTIIFKSSPTNFVSNCLPVGDFVNLSDPGKAVHQRTGDIYFTDPIFGRMTFNANNARGNLDEIRGLEQPGFSGVYQYHAKSGITSIGNYESPMTNNESYQ